MNNNERWIKKKEYVEWMWKSNPSYSSDIPQWIVYSDIENEIIEEAFQKSECLVSIDDFNIDLKRLLQIRKGEQNDQYVIKRSIQNIEQKPKIRSNRFQPIDSNCLITKKAFTDTEYKYNFVLQVSDYFKLIGFRFDNSILQMIVEKAAEGLIIEGTLVKKETEAEWMAQQLKQVKNSSAEDIWNCCAYLYTRDSFLYREINKIMRYAASEDEDKKEIWQSKIPTIGPFTWLLSELRKNNLIDTNINVYRGSTLSDDLIKQLQSVEPNVLCYFPAFTSVTSDPEVANMYAGNTIFHLNISADDGNDISFLSQFPDEKEILIAPFLLFTIKSCIQNDNRWNIELTSFIAEFTSLEVPKNSVDSTLVNTHSYESSDDSSATSVNSSEI